MANETNCRKCGAPLSHEARDGVCSKYLLDLTLISGIVYSQLLLKQSGYQHAK